MSTTKKRTIWILPDQLSIGNAALLSGRKGNDTILFIESLSAFSKLKYHRHRLLLLLSAMRHFARELTEQGWDVRYYSLADAADSKSVLERYVAETSPDEILIAEPNSHDERSALLTLADKLPIPLTMIPTQQFLCSREEFEKFASGKKRLLMEHFYREMRRSTGLLLEPDGTPTGGAWNYDAENRSGFREWLKAGKPTPSNLPKNKMDNLTQEVAKDLETFFPAAIGLAEDFSLPVTRKQAKSWLEDFISNRLANFGAWQDVMVSELPDLFHSILSPMLNIGLLDPLECAKAAEDACKRGVVPLSATEGFIRQIIGWREFINGVYWLKMPEYADLNTLGANRPLPVFFWHGETEMNCVQQVLTENRQKGFNHHIQRLMILGNFLLLAGISPQEALRWFNAMYVDAHDWVMAANVLGMALHADGGFMATKPYACSAAYISRMSNYCAGCAYDPSLKISPKNGKKACPFNLLYWNFYNQHGERFANNPRAAMPVRSWRKRPESERLAIVNEAQKFLKELS